MSKRITFDEVKKLLEKGKADGALLKDVDAIMGLIVFFAPLAAGLPPGTADVIVEVLDKREALVKAGERLIERFAEIGAGDEVARYRVIEASHLLISYSAFFDAVDHEIKGFWKTLALDESVQTYLTERAKAAKPEAAKSTPAPPEIPHPLTTFKTHLDELAAFYRALSQVIAGYLEVLKVADIDAAAKAHEYAALRESIVTHALERYQAQYVELAKKFPEFHLYANFHFREEVGDRLRALSDAALASQQQVDVGFSQLAGAIDQIGRKPAADTVADLRTKYEANGRKRIYPEEIPGLTFPRRCDIFLPQAYRAVRYRTAMRIDSEDTWRSISVQEDLGPFLERCLESPHTLDRPILILGQPGSGKSMLTHMIGSVLGGRFDTVRVELRSVQADAKIYSQIGEFVSQDTQGRHVTWPELRDQFTAPPVVILDGFDELLQATGKVFAAYLEDCAEFQGDALDFGRPLRTIVTSRIALINRAHIPEGTIVIRLEPFDARRRQEWARIWNDHNQSFFSDPAQQTTAFDPARLQADIRDLAEQPLLLLMLAIYDSDGNRLAGQSGLNRTALYHSLVRSFVEREQKRLPGFDNLSARDQTERIDLEMRRLGIAGLTMFNRRKREITGKDTDEALATFQLTYQVKDGQALGQAERLFDRFFFVTKSETAVTAAADATYEFLHATFAEFLAAFTIARRIIDSCNAALVQASSERQHYVSSPNALPAMWFECLMHAPIFNEPVVLSMLQEWMPQEAGDRFPDILQQLEEFVSGQAMMLLDGNRFPDSFKQLPVQGHAAIYSANLITIAAALKGELIFNERLFRTYPDEARPWDRLTHLWRSWFSLRVLANLGAVVTTRRDKDQVTIRAKKQIEDAASIEPGIERLHAAASGLGDHVLLGLSGYFLADPPRHTSPSLDEVDAYLASEGYSIAEFTRFRRIPLEHGPIAKQQLMALVLDQPVLNYEIWLRAIWMLTSEPARFVQWASIDAVTQHKDLTERLIAGIAGPNDCVTFYSSDSVRPVQLQFAKRSGGRARYKETYERVLAAEAGAHWSVDEQMTVVQAAVYFGDAATATRLRKAISAVLSAALVQPTSWWRRLLSFNLNSQIQQSLAMFDVLRDVTEAEPAAPKVEPTPPEIKQRFISFGSGTSGWISRRLGQARTVTEWLGHFGSLRPNPYLPGFAKFLRARARDASSEPGPVELLAMCVDLPVDVQIELLNSLRRGMIADGSSKGSLDFPMKDLADVSLASVSAARQVAQWMGRSDAVEMIDKFLAPADDGSLTNGP